LLQHNYNDESLKPLSREQFSNKRNEIMVREELFKYIEQVRLQVGVTMPLSREIFTPVRKLPLAKGGNYFMHAEHKEFAPRRFIHDSRL